MDYGEEDLGADLQEALRRSWAEPIQRGIGVSSTALSDVLEVCTPTDTPLGEQQMLEPELHKAWARPLIAGGSAGLPTTPKTADTGNTVNQEYSLLKHHYSFPRKENECSVGDLLNDLNTEMSEQLNPTERLQEGILDVTNDNNNDKDKDNFDDMSRTTATHGNQQSGTKRRVSIQDSPWVRQMRNPRSSFSGSSMNYRYTDTKDTIGHESKGNISSNSSSSGSGSGSESSNNTPISSNEVSPLAADSNPNSGTENHINSSNRSLIDDYRSNCENRCWVTVLRDDSAESLRTVLVLNHSITETKSKFPLYVIYDATSTEPSIKETIEQYGLSCIPVSKDSFVPCEVQPEKGCTWLILSIFVFLAGKFDVVCYIAPECVLTDNIDELLSSEQVCSEIDNETCVLLTNSTGVGERNITSNFMTDMERDALEPQLLLIRPNDEVAMCIREYFTVYGEVKNGASSAANELRRKIYGMNDFDVLRELFRDSWGEVSSAGYVWLLTEDFVLRPGLHLPKILDFRLLKPWNTNVVVTNVNGKDSNMQLSLFKHNGDTNTNIGYGGGENSSSGPVTITIRDHWLQIWYDILRCAEG